MSSLPASTSTACRVGLAPSGTAKTISLARFLVGAATWRTVQLAINQTSTAVSVKYFTNATGSGGVLKTVTVYMDPLVAATKYAVSFENLRATATHTGGMILTVNGTRVTLPTLTDDAGWAAAADTFQIGIESINTGQAFTVYVGNVSIDKQAAVAYDIGTIKNARKAADTVRTNTATLANDPDLTVPVVAGGVYEVESLLVYDASTTGDFKIGWAYPVGSTFIWTLGGATSGTTALASASADWRAFGETGTPGLGGGGVGTLGAARPTGTFTAGANGALTLQWAQATAKPPCLTLRAGSRLRVRRIA